MSSDEIELTAAGSLRKLAPVLALTTRRRFVQQTICASATALCGLPGARFVEAKAVWPQQTENTLDPAATRKLAAEISGRIITPGGPDYDSARLVFNRAFDRRPALIVRCAVASDVVRVLDFVQNHNLPVAVRGGGHSRLGYGVCDGGMVIDLSGMKRIQIDAGKRIARVQAGALVHDLDLATQRFGLATTLGACPTVGIAGLTLGGGEGRLMEKYGAACDNLLSAQMVTVGGRQVAVNQESNSDLFWAIRGGGGNFGVVTALEFRLHPVGEVLSGALMYPIGRIPELLQVFARFIAGAPDDMDAFAQVLPSERGARLMVGICHCGDPGIGNDLIRPLRALKPQDDNVRVMPYLEAQAAGGFLQTPVTLFQTDLVLQKLSEAEIGAITTASNNAPPGCKVIIVPLRGAVCQVAVTETAFALRQRGFEIDITGVWSDPAEKANAVRWVQATRDSLQPFARGVYVNQLGDTSDLLIRSAYGPNYARLAELKRKYDPENVLRLNQNIKPDS